MTRQATATAIKLLKERLDSLEARIGDNGDPFDDPPDSLVPDAVVQEEFGVGPMGLHRWDADLDGIMTVGRHSSRCQICTSPVLAVHRQANAETVAALQSSIYPLPQNRVAI